MDESRSQYRPRERFSNRAEDYRRYRPDYPPALLGLLESKAGLAPKKIVADLGSGTGILTDMLLRYGCRVLAIEPNAAMRAAAESALGDHSLFYSIAATAEASGLAPHSINLVVAAQAFHWFEPDAARREFARILAPGGRAVLIWNERDRMASPFMDGYEALLERYGTDYDAIPHRNIGDRLLAGFFREGEWSRDVLPHAQRLDWPALQGRLLSSSYISREPGPRFDAMMKELRELFDRHAQADEVRLIYQTVVFTGEGKSD